MKKNSDKILFGAKGIWKEFLINMNYQFEKYKYINKFVKLCENKKIQCLFPLSIDHELFLIENSQILRKKGYKFLVPSQKNIQILDDKSEFVTFMINNNLDKYIPKKYDNIQFPCILKKNISIYGRDGYVINSIDDIPQNIDLKDYLIQEPIPGNCEYSTDILAKNGEIIEILPSRYCYHTDLFIGGCKIVMTPAFHEEVTPTVLEAFSEIIKILNYNGFCNIDYKVIDTGYPKIFEINPRCGGSLREQPVEIFKDLINKYTKLCD